MTVKKLSLGERGKSHKLTLNNIASSPRRGEQPDPNEYKPLDSGSKSAKFKSVDISKLRNASIHEKEAIDEMSLKKWNQYLSQNQSIVSDVLMGQFLSKIECNTCQSASYNFEPFYLMELSIPEDEDEVTLAELLRYSAKPDLIEGFKWNCPKCKVQKDITKTTHIYKLPPVLALCFKRFEFAEGELRKNNCLVKMQIQGEDFSRFEQGGDKSSKKIYVPYLVIVKFSITQHHFGDLDQGHYTCSYFDNQEWTVIDDASVRVLKENDAVI